MSRSAGHPPPQKGFIQKEDCSLSFLLKVSFASEVIRMGPSEISALFEVPILKLVRFQVNVQAQLQIHMSPKT